MKRLIKVIPLTIVVFVLLFAAYILAPIPLPKPFYVQMDMGDASAASAATPTAQPTRAPTAAHGNSSGAVLYDVGTRIVNLADPMGRRYLKLALVIEVTPNDPLYFATTTSSSESTKSESGHAAAAATVDPTAAQKVVDTKMSTYKPAIDDMMTALLSTKTAEELFTLDGKNKLKQEMQQRLNGLLKNVKVTQLYFTDFLIQ